MGDQQQQPVEVDFSQLSLVDYTINDEIRDKCRLLCTEYLDGPWGNLSPEEILVETVMDGLSNRIYSCTNLKLPRTPNDCRLKADVPSRVLVRLHGSKFVGEAGDMIVVDKVALPFITERLHLDGLAPKIYALFEEGRIEHFVESEKFPKDQWSNQELLNCIVRKMAEIHQLEMPISKDPWSLLKMAEKAYQFGQENNQFLSIDLYEPDHQTMIRKLIEYDFVGTCNWLRDMSQYIKSPNVFCHNDVHFGNILKRFCGSTLDEQVFIIDYDNASYGPRAYDLSFFLTMKSFIPGRIETWADIVMTTLEERRHYLGVYLDHLIRIRDGQRDPEVDTLEHLEREMDWARVLLETVFNGLTIKKIDPAMAQIFSLFRKFSVESEIEVAAAKERCNDYKRQVVAKATNS